MVDFRDGTAARPWHFDEDVLDAQAAADGWYALLTNLIPEQASAQEVFLRYKEQGLVERPLPRLQGPARSRTVFLQHNRRIAALITVICLALPVFCLIGRQVRQALGSEQTMRGLYPDNCAVRPTGRMIFGQLSSLTLRPGSVTDAPVRLISRGVQARLLEPLGVDETRPRWLGT
ncbi:hypothetical protein [Streptomyces europaeiscabiei]|uniref:hypothetical protein n=1 Tax=Streptomyces europaeiscabiei TaxID=146819 RepID=UPI002E268094|nr:hypothetical protein OG858_05750 [Streptomyces europaeiscabiei]